PAETISSQSTLYVGDETPEVRPLGVVKLDAESAAGIPIGGISALAWDQDEAMLYAVSDNGILHHLRPLFDGDKLVAIDLLASYRLHNKQGKPLKDEHCDAEGAYVVKAGNGIKGDSELVISFEKTPRIIRFSPQGQLIEPYSLTPVLADKSNYNTANQMLEAVAPHPDKGILTIAQRPMKGRDNQLLHALNGETWEYRMEQDKGNSVTAMESLADGRILFMERAWDSLMSPLVVTFKEGYFTEDGKLELRVVARLDSSKGWALDNFEGLAHHRARRFFMASDDNDSLLQRTLLFYFEMTELQ
ncbi:MAG: esterase-like activity of phytase family protein, partial [Pseudomonadota bacterium]